jgi:ADP-ribose pyrophosphatase YjhB (NUDIX family)
VIDDESVLLVRRGHAESPWYDAWCAPGGFCEVGEHPIQTLEREVYEETGLRVEATAYLGVWVDAYADSAAAEDAEVINVGYYRARVVGSGGSVDPAEVSEVAWFAWDELPESLAPPATLESVLEVARVHHGRGAAPFDLPDRPR